MEIFEVINNILLIQKTSKREFAQKLILLEPKSNRTGEIISEKIIYSYLSGKTAIKAYLIPYISDVLDIPEQLLFEENKKVRKRLIDYLLKTLEDKEADYMRKSLAKDFNEEIENEILELIEYAPKPLLLKIQTILQTIKNDTQAL